MRDMEGTRKRATGWIVFSALYATAAAIAAVFGFFWAEAFVPMICMICAAACFELGRDYQFELYYEGLDKKDLKIEDEMFKWWIVEENTYAKVLCCKRCHGTDFRKVADRLVCNTCGEVMEHGKDET